MSSVLDKNVPVSQPVYCRDTGSGEIDFDTPMYSWMAVRASGPNILKDTTLCGDTLTLGYSNSNSKEGQEPQENQLIPPSRRISKKLIWATNPPTFNNFNMPAALTVAPYNLTANNSYNLAQAPGCVIYMAYQNSPGPISAFFPDPTNPANPPVQIEGDTFLEIDGLWAGAVVLAAYPNYGTNVYANANPIIVETNINKYGQISSFGVSKCVMNKGETTAPIVRMPEDAVLWTASVIVGGANGFYNSAICTPDYNPFVGSLYIPVNGLAIYSPTTALTDTNGFYCNLSFTLDCVVNDSAPTNPDAGSSPAPAPPP